MKLSRSKTIIPLLIPVVLAYGFVSVPVVSYLLAWLGSFFIFYLTWFSKQRLITRDLTTIMQLTRPIFLLQLIFAGFMCCTSIFYFLDHLGYVYLERSVAIIFKENHQTALIAECQRLALLAHTALVIGMVLKINPRRIPIQYHFQSRKNFLIPFTFTLYIIGLLFEQIGGLSQFGIFCSAAALNGATLLFVKGIVIKNRNFLLLGSLLFVSNFLNATLSGFKEPIITNLLLLGILLLPYYKRTILILAPPILYIMFYFLPTYAMVVRKSWSGETTAIAARDEALNLLQEEDNQEEIDQTNWGFLVGRLSEINMFIQFVDYVPSQHDYYGWKIIDQSATALVPRIFWPDKPITEIVAMDRVYEAGVASRSSNVSAKTRPIVDAYLSWGTLGIVVFMFLFGILIQWLSNTCERFFGGYEFGCIVIFNGIFQILWRGNNFEFMFNNILYGMLTTAIIFWVLKRTNVLQKNMSLTEEIQKP